MKHKLITSSVLASILAVSAVFAYSPSALADGHGHGYRGYREIHEYHHGGGGDWLAPLVIGGVAGYVLAQPRQPQTVIVQQPQVQPLPQYVPANGEPIYQYQTVYDANCNCYQRVLVQIN